MNMIPPHRRPRVVSWLPWLALGAAVACLRTSATSHAQPRPPDASTARIDGGASRTRPLEAQCAPRPRTRDPGPTAGTAGARPPSGVPGAIEPVSDHCTRHAQCIAYPHGRCAVRPFQEVQTFGVHRLIPAHNECVYDDCTSDVECRAPGRNEPRADGVCNCDAAERNTCGFANCRTDADCPAPFACGSYRYCHAAADECRTNATCPTGRFCVYDWDVRHYACRAPAVAAPP